jgi:hypothetical protein
MAHEEVANSFLVDPAAVLNGPQPKIVGEGLPWGTPIEEKISQQLDDTTLRSLRLIDKALGGSIDLGDTEQRARLGLASAVLGAWSRWQQTQTNRMGLQMRSQELGARPVVARLAERTQ